MDILRLLSLPEGKTLEFKRDLSSPKPVLRTLVAFANTAGGTLIIGRADDGAVVGVNDVLTEEERLASLIADSIAPAMMPEIEAITVEDKTLLLVRVAHWPGPFYLKESGATDGVYVRLGSTNRKADAAMLAELERFRSNHSFDQLPCAEVGEEALDDALIRRWFETIGKKMRASDLESMEILVPHGSRKVVSNGGMILFGREEVRNRYFPDANVSCALFHGATKSRFLDRKDIGGGILGALEEVPKFIARNSRLAAKIENIRRRDIPEYSVVAVREVLINALAHADYGVTGMRLFVSIFSDRLEIQNPGMLPFGMTLEDFKSGVSRVRNRVIAQVLHRLEIMERWGSGYERIREACREGGYPEPEWQEMGMCTRVIFRPHPDVAASAPANVPANVPVNVPVKTEGLSERQQWFMEQLSAGRKVKAADIEAQWNVVEKTAKRDIAELRKLELVEFVGAAKTGSYRLKLPGKGS